MEKFIPVKITDKCWANKLLDGEVFMRPLRDFGVWRSGLKDNNEQLDNDFRGDIYEGTAALFSDINDCAFADGMDPEFKKIVKQVTYIDEDYAKYFKIFSLYCMEYDAENDFFVKPDQKMKEFGDTAVIFENMNVFIERLGKALFTKYKHHTCLMDRVKFFNINESRTVDCMFEKLKKYSYQNELRIAFGELEQNIYALGPDADSTMRLVEDLEQVKLQIGDIRDIARVISIEDFLMLRFPPHIRLYWPMSDDIEHPSNFDNIVKLTHERMENTKSHFISPMVTIW